MKYLKVFLLVIAAVLINGCESNDTSTNSVYIPKPVNKKVLVEFFTNAGCNPCIAAHHYLDEINQNSGATINDTSVIILSYHTKYPYIFDSLYRANVPQNQGRCDYYGVNTTPQGRLDGINMSQYSSTNWSAQINAEFKATNYLDITLSNTYDVALDTGTVSANISLVNALPSSNNVLHVIITENNISYVSAPNGITSPDDVMRNMVTGKDGESVTIGQVNTISKGYSLNANWNPQECYIIVFIQNPDTKQVFGVERIKVIP
ncbi:MAG: Omp28-related outer membrane protein [Ignavibacteria bacterium]